jgi:hypothetical protein
LFHAVGRVLAGVFPGLAAAFGGQTRPMGDPTRQRPGLHFSARARTPARSAAPCRTRTRTSPFHRRLPAVKPTTCLSWPPRTQTIDCPYRQTSLSTRAQRIVFQTSPAVSVTWSKMGVALRLSPTHAHARARAHTPFTRVDLGDTTPLVPHPHLHPQPHLAQPPR